jgi:NAD(P)-dependent dehydrogenase (short-subunit alcohol dehydrogenase family)
MAEQGALVAIADILETEGRELMRELASRDFDVRYFHCDVSKEEDVARTLAETVANFGRLDILVNVENTDEYERVIVMLLQRFSEFA